VASPVVAKWAKGTGGPAGDEVQNLIALPFALRGREEGARVEISGEAASAAKGAGGGASRDYVAVGLHGETSGGVDGTARAGDSSRGHPGGVIEPSMSVRRLTPLECERLQGVPDGWTDIPGASDSARYKALGNGVAIPPVAWIARRLIRAEKERRVSE